MICNRAKHIRLFGLVYRQPQRSYIDTGVVVSINNSSAVSAFKTLVCSFSDMITHMASLRRVGRWHNHQRNSIKFSFVSNILSQLRKVPFTKLCSKLFISTFGCKPDIGQILNRNSFTLLFSRFYNRLCNSVINNTRMGSLFAGKTFQEAFSPFRSFALNRTTNFLPMFTVFVKSISRKLNIIGSMSDCGQTKIHTHEALYVLNIFFGYINGLKKIKLIVFINQISFSFDVWNVVRVMTNKINLLSTANTPQRNHVIRLVGHYPTVISNTTKWFKGTFGFLIQLISISNFSNLPDKHLRRKIERSFVRMVNFVMEFKIIENLFLPSHIRNGITNSISFLHCIEKQISLFVSGQKFYFQCQLHSTNIQLIFLYQKKLLFLLNNLKRGSRIPPNHPSG